MSPSGILERDTIWDAQAREQFHALWNLGAPLPVIAIIMERSPASIQTKASRESLPEREVPAYAVNHRRKWSDDQNAELEALIQARSGGPGYWEIDGFARRAGRTIDAVAGRIQAVYGAVALTSLVADYQQGRVPRPKLRAGPAGAPPNTNRRCIVTSCRAWFWAKDKTRDYKCNKCRKEHQSMSDSDIDFWADDGGIDV